MERVRPSPFKAACGYSTCPRGAGCQVRGLSWGRGESPIALCADTAQPHGRGSPLHLHAASWGFCFVWRFRAFLLKCLNKSVCLDCWGGTLWTPKAEGFSQTYVALAPTETLGNGALYEDFKLFISMFYMDILLCINTSQTLYLVLMSSNTYFKGENGTELSAKRIIISALEQQTDKNKSCST